MYFTYYFLQVIGLGICGWSSDSFLYLKKFFWMVWNLFTMDNLFKYFTFCDSPLYNSKLGLFFTFGREVLFLMLSSHFFPWKFKKCFFSVANLNPSHSLFPYFCSILSVHIVEELGGYDYLNSDLHRDPLCVDGLCIQVLLLSKKKKKWFMSH